MQVHSLCKMVRTIDILKEYLRHAHNRSIVKYAEVDNEDDFFALVVAPNIQGGKDEVEVLFSCVECFLPYFPSRNLLFSKN